jgi:hypothetical protein
MELNAKEKQWNDLLDMLYVNPQFTPKILIQKKVSKDTCDIDIPRKKVAITESCASLKGCIGNESNGLIKY